MTSTDDPYQFSMDDSFSETPRTRSSSRNRKPANKKPTKKAQETISKPVQQRIVTRSSQKSPITAHPDENDTSFMSNINSGFSQFVNSKKRQRDEKKNKTQKRAKVNAYNDENQAPNDEIQDIERVKLAYETAAGRTNLARAAATNAQILAHRQAPKSNTTYSVNAIEDTQVNVIPDTLVEVDSATNDSSWQRDIDRLLKKLEEPSPAVKSQTQVEETQIVDEQEETIGSIYPSPTANIPRQNTQPTKTPTTTTIQKETIGIQTDSIPNSSSLHECCQDVSNCPCVLKYSKLERLFMEKMSRFISIVPTVPNTTIETEHYPRRRPVQTHSRFRRFRGHRRINHRMTKPLPSNNQSTTLDDDEEEEEMVVEARAPTVTEIDNQIERNVIPPSPEVQNESTIQENPTENVMSTTVTIEKNPTALEDLSAIEKLDATSILDHPSTLMISSTDNTCPTNRSLVLTTSSLDENQKAQFRLFVDRFHASTSSSVDSSTTHIIVNEQSPLVCPLTGKIIQGIARHLFIVSHRWLNECLSENVLIDERPYEIRGDSSLGNDHGGMRRSRLTPSFLLENYSIYLRCTNNDCAPLQTIEQVQELIQLCGGRLVRNFSEIKSMDQQRQIVLVMGVQRITGGEEKRQNILNACQQFNVRCVNIHWLLISIAKFDIQPLDNFDINQV